jgi:GNAT superfamily N-acetyltransferase
MKSTIREFKETDRDYVARSVLYSFMNGSKEVQKINRDSYFQAHNLTVNNLLNHCKCLVICDGEDFDLIYAFIIYENLEKFDVLHYLYVRKEFRHNRFAAELLAKMKSEGKNRNLSISHLTDEFRPARLKRLWEKVIYDPYARLFSSKAD